MAYTWEQKSKCRILLNTMMADIPVDFIDPLPNIKISPLAKERCHTVLSQYEEQWDIKLTEEQKQWIIHEIRRDGQVSIINLFTQIIISNVWIEEVN